MAIDPDHCATCYALANSSVEVTAHPTDDPNVRRFVANVPLSGAGAPADLASSAEARVHPLGRVLWGSGVQHLVIAADGVTVTKIEAMPWDFIEGRLAQVLGERITLAGGHEGT